MTNTAYVTLDNLSVVSPIPLADTFGGGSLDSAKWTQFLYLSGTGTVSEGSGSLSEDLTNTGVLGIGSNTAYDLTASAAYVEVPSINGGSGAETVFTLITALVDPSVGSSSLYKLEFAVAGGSLAFGYYNGPSGWNPTSVTYSATAHKFWRFRESAGTLYWETSPDGSTWTTQRSEPAPFSLTSLYVNLWTELAAGTAEFANFNTPAIGPVVVSAAAVVLSPADDVVSELSVQASFSYGENLHDIQDAVEAALRVAAGDPSLHTEFIG